MVLKLRPLQMKIMHCSACLRYTYIYIYIYIHILSGVDIAPFVSKSCQKWSVAEKCRDI